MADDFKILIDSDLDLKNAESKIQNFLNKYNGKEKIKLDVELDTNVLKNITKQFETIGNGASSAFKKGFESSNLMSVSDFTKTKKDILKQVNDTQKEISRITGSSYNKKTINESVVNQWANEYTRAQQNAIKKANNNAIKELEKIINIQQKFKNQSSDLDFLKSAVKDGGTQKYGKAGYEKLTSQIKAAEVASQKLNAELKNGENANLDKLNADMKEFTSLANKATREQNRLSESVSINKQLSALKDFDKYWKSNTAAHKDFDGIYNNYRSVLSGDRLTVGQYEDIISKIKIFKKDIDIAGKSGVSFKEESARAFKKIGQFAYTYGTIQRVGDAIANSVRELKEMDTTLTEISKTSDLTSAQLKELGQNSFDKASEFGKKANDYLVGVQEMSRSGFYGKQAEELARLSILGQSAGDMSADVSNSYLLATNAAYEYKGSAEKLNAVLDGQNMINKMVMLYRNIWLRILLLSRNIQRWTIGRIS